MYVPNYQNMFIEGWATRLNYPDIQNDVKLRITTRHTNYHHCASPSQRWAMRYSSQAHSSVWYDNRLCVTTCSHSAVVRDHVKVLPKTVYLLPHLEERKREGAYRLYIFLHLEFRNGVNVIFTTWWLYRLRPKEHMTMFSDRFYHFSTLYNISNGVFIELSGIWQVQHLL